MQGPTTIDYLWEVQHFPTCWNHLAIFNFPIPCCESYSFEHTRITIWYTTCSKGFPSILLTFEPEILRIDKSRKGGANRRSSPIQINNFSFEVGWCHEVWVFPSIDGGVKMSFSPILFEVQSPSTDHAKQNNVGSSSGLPSPQQNYRTRSDVNIGELQQLLLRHHPQR